MWVNDLHGYGKIWHFAFMSFKYWKTEPWWGEALRVHTSRVSGWKRFAYLIYLEFLLICVFAVTFWFCVCAVKIGLLTFFFFFLLIYLFKHKLASWIHRPAIICWLFLFGINLTPFYIYMFARNYYYYSLWCIIVYWCISVYYFVSHFYSDFENVCLNKPFNYFLNQIYLKWNVFHLAEL